MVARDHLAAFLIVVSHVFRVQGQTSKFWSVVSGNCFVGQPLSCKGTGLCFNYLGNGYSYAMSPDDDCVSTISFPLNGHYGPVGCVINVSDSAWNGYVLQVDYFGVNAQDFLVVNGQNFQSGISCTMCSDGTLTSSVVSATSCDSGTHVRWNNLFCQYCGCQRMPGLQGLRPKGLITFNITESSPTKNYGNPAFLGPAFGFRLCPMTAAQNEALPALTPSQIIWISIVVPSVVIMICIITVLLRIVGEGWDFVFLVYCCPCLVVKWSIEKCCGCEGWEKRVCRCCRCCRRAEVSDGVRDFNEVIGKR